MHDVKSLTGVVPDVLLPRSLIGAGSGFDGLVAGDCLRGDLVLRDGRVVGLTSTEPGPAPRVVLPAPVEAHCHLDKCHTFDRIGGTGGDLMAAIAAQVTDKVHWSESDLHTRCSRGLAELEAAGCGLVRTHVDWGEHPEPPLAWHVLDTIAQDNASRIRLDRAALTGVDQLARDGFAMKMAHEIASDDGTLGAFAFDQPERAEGLRAAFAAADRFGLALDFHVDEGLSAELDGLELIADIALETGFEGPVLCGHACSLMNLPEAAVARVADKLANAGIVVCALPVTNLYLQDRRDGTPDRRGLTRLRELHDAGVRIVVGSDNVADAFCPTGQHDPVAALHLAILTGHLDPPFDRWLPAITTNAAAALGAAPTFIAGAPASELRISAAPSLAELISGRCGPPTLLTDQIESIEA